MTPSQSKGPAKKSYRIRYRIQPEKAAFWLIVTMTPTSAKSAEALDDKGSCGNYGGLSEKPKNGPGRFEDQGHHQVCKHSQSFSLLTLRHIMNRAKLLLPFSSSQFQSNRRASPSEFRKEYVGNAMYGYPGAGGPTCPGNVEHVWYFAATKLVADHAQSLLEEKWDAKINGFMAGNAQLGETAGSVSTSESRRASKDNSPHRTQTRPRKRQKGFGGKVNEIAVNNPG